MFLFGIVTAIIGLMHVSNNVTFLKNIFDPQLVASVKAEPVDMEGPLYLLRQRFS